MSPTAKHLVLLGLAPLAFAGKPSAATCSSGAEKYWALDKPNNECAEACLSTAVQRAEWWVLTGGQGSKAGDEANPCADHGFHKFDRTDVLGAGPVQIALDKYLPDKTLQGKPSAEKCAAGSEKYWALDKPNNECAEACLSTEIQRAEWWVLTGGQGAKAGDEAKPCADHGFHAFNRTDVLGPAGPLQISLDKYLPDKSLLELSLAAAEKNQCALACTGKAIGVYWACAGVCIKENAPAACITAGCLATVAAYDVSCLKGCPKPSEASPPVLV
jgi:hypothetical protein